MTTPPSESAFALRPAVLAGVAAALAIGTFLAGAWAGVEKPWPVRFSLRLLEGSPKPIATVPETKRMAADSAGRLLDYPGKTEVACPKQDQRTAVFLIAGQSNAANNAARRHATRYPDRVLNFVEGRCYVAASPLLGSTGFAGELWTLTADRLIDAGAFNRVILASVAVGGSDVALWARNGGLNETMIPLVTALTDQYHVTHVLWHQGESDLILGTDPARYKQLFQSFVDTLRAEGIDAPVYVSEATRCGPGWKEPNGVRTAQQELGATILGLKPGVDTDRLLDAQDRYDDCHFADSGEVKAAAAWAALLAPGP